SICVPGHAPIRRMRGGRPVTPVGPSWAGRAQHLPWLIERTRGVWVPALKGVYARLRGLCAGTTAEGFAMKTVPRLVWMASLALSGVTLSDRLALADPVADFYHGRTINLLIGVNVGGSYDRDARLVARYLGSHLPGNPTVVPQNMIGSGGIVM